MLALRLAWPLRFEGNQSYYEVLVKTDYSRQSRLAGYTPLTRGRNGLRVVTGAAPERRSPAIVDGFRFITFYIVSVFGENSVRVAAFYIVSVFGENSVRVAAW